MTDTNPPEPNEPDELDELASAVLDDEATEGEPTRAAHDTTVERRVQEFRALAAEIGGVPHLSEDAREAILVQAMRDAGPAALTHAEPTPTPVASLDARRNRRGRSVLPLAAVAAVVIAILAIPALLISVNRDSGVHDVAVSTADQDAALDESSTAAEVGSAANATPTTPSTSATARGSVPTAVALGDVSSPEELQASVHQQLGAASPTTEGPVSTTTLVPPTSTTVSSAVAPVAPDVFGTTSCETQIRDQIADLGILVLSGTVDYRGISRQVFAFQVDETGPVSVVVAAWDGCAVVAQTTVTPD